MQSWLRHGDIEATPVALAFVDPTLHDPKGLEVEAVANAADMRHETVNCWVQPRIADVERVTAASADLEAQLQQRVHEPPREELPGERDVHDGEVVRRRIRADTAPGEQFDAPRGGDPRMDGPLAVAPPLVHPLDVEPHVAPPRHGGDVRRVPGLHVVGLARRAHVREVDEQRHGGPERRTRDGSGRGRRKCLARG